MQKEIKVDKKLEIILKVVIILSTVFFTFIASLRYKNPYVVAGAITSGCIMAAIMIYKIEIKKINKRTLLYSLLPTWISFGMINQNVSNSSLKITLKSLNDFSQLQMDIIKLLALPAIFYFVYLFIEKIIPIVIQFFKNLDKSEKVFILITSIIALILPLVLTDVTTAFLYPVYQGKVHAYDVIYTMDFVGDVYHNLSSIANDVRNPLFGIFAFPFAVIAETISRGMNLGRAGYSFLMTMTSIHLVIIAITLILLARMLHLEEKEKKNYYALCYFTLPFSIVGVTVEQYVISVFYLILFLYLYTEKNNKKNYLYVASTGTILTSGVLFPLISKEKKIKKWIKDVWDCFLVFVSITVIGGQYPQIFEAVQNTKDLLGSFSGGVILKAKIFRFSYFIKDMFFATPGEISYINGFPSYRTIKPNAISIIGLILFVICLISIFLNRKNKVAILSAIWVAFSIVLLVGIGWGAIENGYFLYSYYFSWAYLTLYYLFLKKVFEKNSKLFHASLLTTIFIMILTNLPVFYKIIDFATTYYK